jgi:DNA-binding NtrC family response regulator
MTAPAQPHISYTFTVDPAATPRILVIDDEPAVLFAYRKIIEKSGFAVDICETLDDAISNINSRQYVAVIADLRLAGYDNCDGLEILRFVRTHCPGTKTILATGYGDNDVEKTALAIGVTRYFKKPVQPSDILHALEEPAT